MTSKESIKIELVNYKPTDEERVVIRSAVFNFITLATLGAATFGMSARLWARSRATPTKPRTAIPTILGTFAGLTFGGALGMDRGMHRLRESLPKDSQLLGIIHENDALKEKLQQETLFGGGNTSTTATIDSSSNSDEGAVDLFSEDLSKENDSLNSQLDVIETQLLLDDGSSSQDEKN